MSHRKRVRAYWNRVAREKRAAELFSSINSFYKGAYSARLVFPDASRIISLALAGNRNRKPAG